MKSNITEQQYFSGDLQLSEPHFDEEATLLSARRVVPIGEVRTEPRSRRRLAFGMAIVVAVLVGGLAATLIYKQGQKQGTALVEPNTPLSEPSETAGQPLGGAGGAVSDTNASLVAEDVDDLTKRDGRKPNEARRSAVPLSTRPERAKESLQNEAVYEVDEKELRRAERREARRLRRIAERESKRQTRGSRRRSSDDLSRIREIFEGSPRP